MIYNIPENLWVRVQDSTSDIVYAGYFDAPLDKVLKYLKLGFFKNNCNGLFKVRLHTSKNFNRVYAESNVIDFSQIKESIIVGNVRADFSDVNLNDNTRYYVTIQAVTYTRNGDSNYVGWLHDFPYPTNTSTGNWQNEHPLKMEFFVK